MMSPSKVSMPSKSGVRLRQEAGGCRQIPRGAATTVGGVDGPELAPFVPFGALDEDAELHPPAEVVLVRDVLRVLLELGAGSEQS